MPDKPREALHDDPEAYYWDLLAVRRRDTNKGKTYKRRAPKLPEGNWGSWLTKETEQKLLSSKSLAAVGVMWGLVRRARSKGHCMASMEDIVNETGFSPSAVSRAYRVLQGLGLIKQTVKGHQGMISEFDVYGYRRPSGQNHSQA